MNVKRAIFRWAGVSSFCASLALVLLVFLLDAVDPTSKSRFSVPVVVGFAGVVVLLMLAGPCALLACYVIRKTDQEAAEFPNVVTPFEESCKSVYGAGLVDGVSVELPEPDDFEWCKIFVNGREQLATEERISYEDLLRMTGKVGQPTVTFSVPGGQCGTLVPGGDIKVLPGMIFDVVHTDAA